jgi:Virulence factor
MDAVMRASAAADNLLEERKWIGQSPRYGELEVIEKEVVEEISASYNEKRLHDLVNYALTSDDSFVASRNQTCWIIQAGKNGMRH